MIAKDALYPVVIRGPSDEKARVPFSPPPLPPESPVETEAFPATKSILDVTKVCEKKLLIELVISCIPKEELPLTASLLITSILLIIKLYWVSSNTGLFCDPVSDAGTAFVNWENLAGPASEEVVIFPLPLLYHVVPNDPEINFSGAGKSVIILLNGVILTLLPPYKLFTLPIIISLVEAVTTR